MDRIGKITVSTLELALKLLENLDTLKVPQNITNRLELCIAAIKDYRYGNPEIAKAHDELSLSLTASTEADRKVHVKKAQGHLNAVLKDIKPPYPQSHYQAQENWTIRKRDRGMDRGNGYGR